MMGYGSTPSVRQEVPLFAAGGVQVTSARFVCWQQTYPIGAITSVAPFTIYADRNSPWFLCFWCGLWGAIWLVAAVMGVALPYSGALCFFSFLFCGLCVPWARSKKNSYGVTISTAGMNVRAVVSEDEEFVRAILAALNQALSMR